MKLTSSGADDDGSGTTSSLEGLKALAHANFTPSLPVEFHYFSAEEGGLLGSQAIAKSYEEDGRKVLAMLQMDMTAWVKQGTEERVGIIQDFVDPALTSFIEELIAEYRKLSAVLRRRKLTLQSIFPLSRPNADTLVRITPVSVKPGISLLSRRSPSHSSLDIALMNSIESSFEDSNHNIHTSQDTMNHPEFSFDHMKQ